MKFSTLATWLACRNRKRPPSLVVLHATAGATASGAIAWLRKILLSYHLIVKDQREGDGDVVKCVPLTKVAYHAGKSIGPRGIAAGNSVNDDSIGICLVNRNDGKDPYSQAQYDAVVRLLKEIKAEYGDVTVTTHKAVSPGRKFDPDRFPAEKAAKEAGLRFWVGPGK